MQRYLEITFWEMCQLKQVVCCVPRHPCVVSPEGEVTKEAVKHSSVSVLKILRTAKTEAVKNFSIRFENMENCSKRALIGSNSKLGPVFDDVGPSQPRLQHVWSVWVSLLIIWEQSRKGPGLGPKTECLCISFSCVLTAHSQLEALADSCRMRTISGNTTRNTWDQKKWLGSDNTIILNSVAEMRSKAQTDLYLKAV